MNAFLQKELRLLQPNFLIGLVAALAVLTLPHQARVDTFWNGLRVALTFVFCPAMVIMLALDSFGREVAAGTFAQLLAQPISRSRVWRTKTSLLAAAVLMIWAVWFGSGLVVGKFSSTVTTATDLRELAEVTLLFALVVYSGALWTVLLFRQVAVAFWCTLLTPGALLVTLLLLVDQICDRVLTPQTPAWNWLRSPSAGETILCSVFAAYSLAGFFLAQRLFLRAQDTQWSGGVIALPKFKALPSLRFSAGSLRRFRPWAAMISRELQLHQAQFVIAGGLAVLHLGAIAARHFQSVVEHEDSLTYFLLHHVWYLWLVMPLLAGCAAVAEERRLGTLENQLCLPARRRTQFAVKWCVVFSLSLLFGLVLLVALENLDHTRILPDMRGFLRFLTHATNDSLWDRLVGNRPSLEYVLRVFFPGILLAGITTVTSSIAFYFSTLSRNTLQALGLTILGMLAVFFLALAGSIPEEIVGYPLWHGVLTYLLGVPVLALTGAALAFWNYRRVEPGWPVWCRNLLTLAAALAFVTVGVTSLYHRAWELVLPLEPKHGPARIAASPRVTLETGMGSMAVKLPDGRCWVGNIGYSIPNLAALLTSNWRYTELSGGRGFLAGTNWSSVADCIGDTVGIQTDGSLWVLQKSLPREFYRVFFTTKTPMPGKKFVLEKIGTDKDWKSAVAIQQNALLLKNDGTLWTWRTGALNHTNVYPGLSKLQLEQVGTDTDWAEIYNLSGWVCVRKTDGRIWSDDYHHSDEPSDDIKLTDGRVVRRALFMDQHDWRGMAWAQSANEVAGGFLVGVRDDGTFRLVANWQVVNDRKKIQLQSLPIKQNVQFGEETNWLTTVSFGDLGAGNLDVVTLKNDGTLWRWTFADDPQTHPETATATRLGTSSDWIAIAGSDAMGFRALAADGSLWFWRTDIDPFKVAQEMGFPPLIGVSRRPQKITNIFEAAK